MHNIYFRKYSPTIAFFFGVLFSTATTSIAPVDIFILLLGAFLFYNVIIDRTLLSFFITKESLVLLGFGFLTTLSLFFLVLDQTLFGITTLYLIGLFYVARFLKIQGLRDVLLKGYFVGAVLSALFGIALLIFFKNTELWNLFTQDNRLTLLFSDPNVFGAFLVPAFLLSSMQLLQIRFTAYKTFILHACMLGIMLIALLHTGSKGAYIQGIIALFFLCILEHERIYKNIKQVLIVGALCLTIVGSFIVYYHSSDMHTLRYTASIVPRIENISLAQNLLRERDIRTLFIGTGNGSYEQLHPNGVSAHNTFVRLVVENGMLGLLVFLTFIFILGYRIVNISKRNTTDNVLIASVVGVLVHGLFIDTLHWRHFWLLIALL